MRLSHHFGSTLREAPAGVEAISHQLLVRAGFIRQLGQGLFSYLPLARRSLTKIENILRDEINAIGGQELTMPVAQPAEVWQATGRWYSIGPELARFKDRKERDMALATLAPALRFGANAGVTHEEVVTDLCKTEIRSYRQLPQLVYHIQTKFRDDPRPRAGLIRTREFTMKDSYSLDADEAGLDKQYRAHYQAYFNIFARCGVPAIAVGSDVGMTLAPALRFGASAGVGGSLAHEYMYLAPIGEDTLILCRHCGYAANRQIARFAKSTPAPEEPKPIEKVATPDCKSIEALANFLGVPKHKTAKAVFMIAGHEEAGGAREEFIGSFGLGGKSGIGMPDLRILRRSDGIPMPSPRETRKTQFIFAVVRGDMDVNETKLSNAVKADWLRPATDEEIRATGATPGYASPIGLQNVTVVVDDAVPASPNLVAGANEAGYHLLNTNLGRDYEATLIADLAAAGDGNACINCGQPLYTSRGVEVGNIFKLGTRYSAAIGATFLAADGTQQPIVMGTYGIGSGRLLACVAEEHHDDKGLRWPITIAPYPVHLVALGETETADRVYNALLAAGIEVLYDDRSESPGVKFADADLIGLPLRLTVATKALKNGGIELKRRDRTEKDIVPEADLIARLQAEIKSMLDEIQAKIADVPFK